MPTRTPAVMPLGADDIRVIELLEDSAVRDEETFNKPVVNADHYTDFYFPATQTMNGIFTKVSLYAELPDYAKPISAMLKLSYTASELILEEYSSLTFYMNGSPFYSCHIAVKRGSMQTVLYLEVPSTLLKDGYNLLEIQGYARLTNDEGCRDDFNGANWIRIEDTTCLRIGYNLVPDADDIRYFPYPFISLLDPTGEDCAVTVSDKADNAELEAGLIVMADLAALVSKENNIAFGRESDIRRANTIYFGLADNTPERLLRLLGDEIPQTGALIRRVDFDAREYLLVVSREKEALAEAARFLCDETRVEQAKSREVNISVGEAALFIEASKQSELALEGQYTLKSILGHGASLYGPFRQQVTLYLPVAKDYVLSSESRFSFHIRYSENLNFERSLMTVYWSNGIPLFSRNLSKEGSRGETVSFAVPSDAIGVSGTTITIAFDLEIEDLDCTPRQMNMPWAYIAEDSTIYLPMSGASTLNLTNLPAPFQRRNLLNDVMVVLPSKPTAQELLLCGRAMSMLGSGSSPYGTLKVVRDSEFDETQTDYNMLVIGYGHSNSLFKSLNDSLYFKFDDDFSAIASNSRLILSKEFSTKVGTIQLLVSPYSEKRAMLALCSANIEGIQLIVKTISSEKKRWSLGKEAVIINPDAKATSYQFTNPIDEKKQIENPGFMQVVAANREPMMFMIIGMGCMLLVLLGVILVLRRIRADKKGDDGTE